MPTGPHRGANRSSSNSPGEYLQYLYSEEEQTIVAKNFYRPVNEKVAAKVAGQFAKVQRITIADQFGGWQKARKTHSADGGIFDQIYTPRQPVAAGKASHTMRSLYQPKSLRLPKPRPVDYAAGAMGNKQAENRVFAAVADLQREASGSNHLFYSEIGVFRHSGRSYVLPRFVFLGPGSDDEPVRIGLFAAIHGDEPETALAAVEFLRRLAADPERARGYQVFVYPVCNPTGVEDGTRHCRGGLDLNREFWTGSRQPEVYYLERELGVLAFQGVVALHADDTTHGVYAFVRGATLTEALARPALAAAEKFLPRAGGEVIDSFPAKDALIHHHCYEGVLSNPAELHPAPFEIIFETPAKASSALQVEAAVAALDAILEEYRPFLSIQQNL